MHISNYLPTFTCRLSLVAATVTEKKLQSVKNTMQGKLAAMQPVPKLKLSCSFYSVRNSRVQLLPLPVHLKHLGHHIYYGHHLY